jgi:hypothetical protein
MLFKWAAQVCGVVIKFGKFVAHAVEAVQRAVTLESGVSSFVGALECMFAGDVAGTTADPAPLIIFGLFAV